MTQIDFKTRQQTAWIIIAISFALIGWDIYAAFFTGGNGDTISEVILAMFQKRPVMPFLFGVLAGHLCWPQIERVSEEKK